MKVQWQHPTEPPNPSVSGVLRTLYTEPLGVQVSKHSPHSWQGILRPYGPLSIETTHNCNWSVLSQWIDPSFTTNLFVQLNEDCCEFVTEFLARVGPSCERVFLRIDVPFPSAGFSSALCAQLIKMTWVKRVFLHWDCNSTPFIQSLFATPKSQWDAVRWEQFASTDETQRPKHITDEWARALGNAVPSLVYVRLSNSTEALHLLQRSSARRLWHHLGAFLPAHGHLRTAAQV